MSRSPEPKSVFSRIRCDRSESPRHRDPERRTVHARLGRREKGIFNRETESRYQSSRSRRTEAFLEREDSGGGHWKSRSKMKKSSIEEDDLSQPWVCEEIDPFTPRIRYFDFPKKTRMPNNVKTYDGSKDPKDHLKSFQAAAKVECWAMPTWCHMFNSTLTGSARVWFDDLSPESVDSYDDLKKAFLANFLQQKKCIKDLVEIHHIKQREGESTKDFVQRFKSESRHVKGALEWDEDGTAPSEVKSPKIPGTQQPHWFNGEKNYMWQMGTNFDIPVKIGDANISSTEWMNFCGSKVAILYNRIIGRTRSEEFLVVHQRAHGMLKFPGRRHKLQQHRVAEERIKVAIHLEYPKQTIAIGSTITEDGRKELCGLLRRNLDIFTWKPADMTGTEKRGQVPERNKAIQEEVEKLMEADIMKEVHYHSWLANPVMVKKHDDSWRMCVDFKDLNKACPKDGYPLPEIDWKAESLCEYPFKCFLDAYKGYHQIKMAKEDEEKTTFITSQGILCYSKMPFGLKNAEATYQRVTPPKSVAAEMVTMGCYVKVQ
ncbi:reverse transcriptase domain-containing protein [Tanacetum coccineum]|uniref:Reverse transcriptase domain-containing protein n=1 Tax=Tanacetum coccineum TaxID=301880 RepID=A0ABQ5EZP4_9ASTR